MKTITIDGVEYAPKTLHENAGNLSVWEEGKNYLIRTVTMITLGRLVAVTDKELILTDACWVADTGRFSEALAKGTTLLNEVEMYVKPVIVGRGSIVDATEWIHKLPTNTK